VAVLNIVKFPDPMLRLKAKPVQTFDKSLQKLIDDMFETMHAAPGVGLAAPQIGQSLRLVVIEYADEEKKTPSLNLRPDQPGDRQDFRRNGDGQRRLFIRTWLSG